MAGHSPVKVFAQEKVSNVDSEDDDLQVEPVSKWHPGYKTRFPFMGVLALITIAILACAALAVLVCSNNLSSSKWSQTIAPNVLLSLLNSISSLALMVAVSEGVAIAWWRHAMQGSTVRELHHQWELSSGILNLILHPKSLLTSSIGTAVLAVQILTVNSILYQRATATYSAPDPAKSLDGIGIAAQEFPMTGFVVSNTSFGAQAQCNCKATDELHSSCSCR